MIGREDDWNMTCPVALAAKRSLLRLIQHIMPTGNDENLLYRFVIEYGDFWGPQHLDYYGYKRPTSYDVLVRLGDWVYLRCLHSKPK